METKKKEERVATVPEEKQNDHFLKIKQKPGNIGEKSDNVEIIFKFWEYFQNWTNESGGLIRSIAT